MLAATASYFPEPLVFSAVQTWGRRARACPCSNIKISPSTHKCAVKIAAEMNQLHLLQEERTLKCSGTHRLAKELHFLKTLWLTTYSLCYCSNILIPEIFYSFFSLSNGRHLNFMHGLECLCYIICGLNPFLYNPTTFFCSNDTFKDVLISPLLCVNKPNLQNSLQIQSLPLTIRFVIDLKVNLLRNRKTA